MKNRVWLLIATALILWASSSDLNAQGPDQICFDTGIPVPVLASPGDGSTNVSVTPILEIMTFGQFDPSCVWDRTMWFVIEAGAPLGGQYDFWDYSTIDLHRIQVPVGPLKANTTYCWTASIQSTASGPGGSLVAKAAGVSNCFTTRNDPNQPPQSQDCLSMPEPVLIKPFDNATSVPLEETFEFNPNATVLDPNCTHSESELYILTNASPANIVYSQTLTPGTTTFKIGPNHLLPSASYCWYVVNYSLGTGPGGTDVTSNVTHQNCFQTESGPSVLPPPGGVPPPPGGGMPPGYLDLRNYDRDGDCYLNDVEFFKIIDDWVAKIIDNPMFFDAVDVWLYNTSVCMAASSSEWLSFELVQKNNSLSISMHSTDISKISAEIFNLNGKSMLSQEAPGASLSLSLARAALANGVYLIRVSGYSMSGQLIASQIEKVVLIR